MSATQAPASVVTSVATAGARFLVNAAVPTLPQRVTQQLTAFVRERFGHCCPTLTIVPGDHSQGRALMILASKLSVPTQTKLTTTSTYLVTSVIPVATAD